MRVLHAAKFYPPVRGGMETVVRDLAEGTAADWDVSVVAAHDARGTVIERRHGVRVVRASSWGASHSVPICPSLAFHLWRSASDCVVLHEPNPLAGSALFLRTPSKRLVVWHHSDLLRPSWAPHTYGKLQAALYRRADCVIVSSPNLADASPLVQQARRVAIVPFGIPLERYRRTDPATRAAVEAICRTIPGPRILFVGRLVYYKGLHVLIDAMTSCRGTLMIAGDGPLEADLRRQVSERGLTDRVVFLGHVSDADLPSHYQAADVFVLPSIAKTEAFGVVQLEAMAAGRAVVSTNLPTGVPWVNQDGVSGLVVPPGDADALSTALNRLIDDEALRQRLSRNAASRADVVFSLESMIGRFKHVVETIVRAPEQLESGLVRATVS
jgi:rhamnosyl/mannosyltransferase